MSKVIKLIYEELKDNEKCILTTTNESYGFDASIKADLLHYKSDGLEVLLYVEDDNIEEPDTDNEGMLVLSISYQDKRFTHWHPFGVEDALDDMRKIIDGKLAIDEIFPPHKE